MRNIIIGLVLNIFVTGGFIYGYDYYKKQKEVTLVFTADQILEKKRLEIKSAIVNNEDVQKKEDEYIKTVKTIDKIIELLSKQSGKSIYKKSIVTHFGKTEDVTPIVIKELKVRGLL